MQAAGLSDFYEVCKRLELARNFQFPVLREVLQGSNVFVLIPFLQVSQFILITLLSLFQPPQSFLTTMEEYIREAPRAVTVPHEPLVGILSFSFFFFS